MNAYSSYQQLIQPSWAPPAWMFGPVWSILYVIIAVTFGAVLYKAFQRVIPWRVVVPFALNLVFNVSYTWLQFGLKNYALASVDVLLVLITLPLALRAVYPYARWVALANIPYLLWVSFATALQFSITYLNP